MPQVPDTRGMPMQGAVALLKAHGFVPMTDDPIEESPTEEWTWEGNETDGFTEPLWGRIHSQHVLGGDHPAGTVIPIRVVIRSGERDYTRTEWDDFDEVQHELDHGRPAP